MKDMQLTGKQVSASTTYRYKKSFRQSDIEMFVKFRQQNQILTEKIPSQQLKSLKDIYLHGVTGRDQHNHVVVVDKVGSLKLNELLKILDEEAFVNYTFSRLFNLSEVILKQAQTVIWVFDLSGKIMQLASKKAIMIVTKIIALAVQYFPQIISKIIFVNAPMLFDTVWNQISAKISEQTQNKVLFLSDEQLFQHVIPQLIPQFLGGKIANQQFNKDTYQLKQSNENFTYKNIMGKNLIRFNKAAVENQQKEVEQEKFDFSSLKQAFAGMNFRTPQNSGIASISQTPLNTQADDR